MIFAKGFLELITLFVKLCVRQENVYSTQGRKYGT